MYTVRCLGMKWDRARNALLAAVQLDDGRSVSVAFPVSSVCTTFEAECAAVDIYLPPTVEGRDTIAGLGRMIKRARRAAGRTVKRATRTVRRAMRSTMGRIATQAVHLAKQAARSKALGAALGAAAVAFPAVGGPALAAWATANRVVAMADQAERSVKRVQRGIADARDLTHVRRASDAAQRLQQLSRSAAPAARMLVAATRSV